MRVFERRGDALAEVRPPLQAGDRLGRELFPGAGAEADVASLRLERSIPAVASPAPVAEPGVGRRCEHRRRAPCRFPAGGSPEEVVCPCGSRATRATAAAPAAAAPS